jgi:glycosyltransferase involved in cell wall biosynthesis
VRIAWASPFNVQSAIGKFSKMVVEELHDRGHKVDVVRIESGPELELPQLDSDLRVIDAPDCLVGNYDVLVVNFGNHAPYHAQSIALAAARAPLGIFHDMEMRDFEWGLADRHKIDLPTLDGAATELADRETGDLVHPDARPLLATFAALTCGSVIHGPHYYETIADYCPGDTEIIPLCFPDTGIPNRESRLAAQKRVTIFGVINENKQPARVLEALALISTDFQGVELHLAGAVENRVREKLTRQAKALGLKVPYFHGYISDEVLQQVIESSHAVCCLRYPVTEGGSASLVTALFRGRPLIIPDVASYSAVPDELAYKVSYGEDPRDVAAALTEIFAHGDEATAKAQRAKEWAKDRFSAPAYVDALEPALHRAAGFEPLMRSARNVVPAVTSSRHEPVIAAVEAFAEVFDWIKASQK